jgi:hypothetical protein
LRGDLCGERNSAQFFSLVLLNGRSLSKLGARSPFAEYILCTHTQQKNACEAKFFSTSHRTFVQPIGTAKTLRRV